MKSNNLFLILIVMTLVAGCGGGGGSDGGNSSPQLVSIAVTPPDPIVAIGSTQQFTATGTYSDNSTRNISGSVTWSTSGISQVITSTGLLTATATGATTVTAASGTVSGFATVTVPPGPQLVSIAISAPGGTVSQGSTLQFTATGTFSDNSTQNLTNSVTWSSSGSLSQPISSRGRLTATSTGTTSITASLGAITSPAVAVTVTAPAANVIPITVNGSLCSPSTSAGYINKPCVSVTVCTPGTSTCTVVSDLLLDTGSIGLRLFKSALGSVTPASVSSGSGVLAECVQFADFSSIWGPVQVVDVIMGAEPLVRIPIQVIDASFGPRPAGTACETPDVRPEDAGYTGILGVGLFAEDCGPGCAGIHVQNGLYFSCTGTGCTATSAPQASQVQNPVAVLPVDNNGVVVRLPDVPLGGVPSLNGSLIFGVGTASNNTPAGVTAFTANGFGDFFTTLGPTTFTSSFLDTGSNGLFFGSTGTTQIPICASDPNWYCPPDTTSFTATTTGASGSPSLAVPFFLGNFVSLVNTSNLVFQEIGGPAPGTFDWGLPFFYGRDVFIGIQNRASSLGAGPYWAY